MAVDLPRGLGFEAEALYEPCPASPIADRTFVGVVLNAPESVPFVGDRTRLPVRGYLRLPWDEEGLGDELVDALSFVVTRAEPFHVSVSGIEVLGTPDLGEPVEKEAHPGLLVGKYFNPELAIPAGATLGRYFVYACLGARVSNVVRVDVVEPP